MQKVPRQKLDPLKKKYMSWTSSKLKAASQWQTKKMKKHVQTGRKHLQNTYLIKALYAQCKKEPLNSTLEKQPD